MTDEEIRELTERVFEIQEMQKKPGWQHFTDYGQAEIAARQRALLGGVPKSYEEYREKAGWIAGATAILNALPRLEVTLATALAQKQPVEDEGA